jgi:hypothetical protein
MKIALVALAAGCGVGAWYAQSKQPAAEARAETVATATASGYLQDDVAPALKHWASGDEPAKLQHQLESTVLADPDVTAVRVFGTDGTLVFSSVVNDASTLDPSVADAEAFHDGSVTDSDETALRTYAPVGSLIGEIEQDVQDIRGAATLPWLVAQFGFLGLAIVLLGGAMFAGNGTRSPKVKTAAPKDEQVKQTKKELDGADPEMQKLRSRAEKAEHSRRAMEDQLNVLRSQILSGDAGSQARIGELEGHLTDAHARVTDSEARRAALELRVGELEAAATAADPTQQRTSALETEVATSRARIKELEGVVQQLEARAARAETTTAAHNGQLDEAHTKARQSELQVQEAVDRAIAAERQVEELRARLEAAPTPEPRAADAGELVRQLQDELQVARTSADERERTLGDSVARAASAEQLLAAAEARAHDAEARAADAETRAAAAASVPPVAAPAPVAGAPADTATDQRVRELEIELADARAAAWAAEPEPEGPSLGVVETHAVPEDDPDVSDDAFDDAPAGTPHQVDEADAIRHELERMGQVVEHAGEAGDVDGLRDRLAKTAARKKGRAVGDDRIARSS